MVCGSSFSQCDGQRVADTGARPHIYVDTGDGACRRPPLGGHTRLVIIIIFANQHKAATVKTKQNVKQNVYQ